MRVKESYGGGNGGGDAAAVKIGKKKYFNENPENRKEKTIFIIKRGQNNINIFSLTITEIPDTWCFLFAFYY